MFAILTKYFLVWHWTYNESFLKKGKTTHLYWIILSPAAYVNAKENKIFNSRGVHQISLEQNQPEWHLLL